MMDISDLVALCHKEAPYQVPAPQAKKHAFDPALHPHMPAGNEHGGEFAPKNLDFSNLRTMPSNIEGVEIEKKNLKTGTILAIGGTSGIAVNTARKAAAVWKDMPAYQQKAFDSGWMSSPHPNHTIWHELGHVLFKRTASIDHQSNASNTNGSSNPFFKTIAAQVSRYAGTNGQEFIAEVFAAHRAGRRFPKEVLDQYERLHGPKL